MMMQEERNGGVKIGALRMSHPATSRRPCSQRCWCRPVLATKSHMASSCPRRRRHHRKPPPPPLEREREGQGWSPPATSNAAEGGRRWREGMGERCACVRAPKRLASFLPGSLSLFLPFLFWGFFALFCPLFTPFVQLFQDFFSGFYGFWVWYVVLVW